MRKYSSILGLVFFLFLFQSIFSATDYRVTGSGGSQIISEWGTARNVVNNCANDILVPTNTAAEWITYFIPNKPACVDLWNTGACDETDHCSGETWYTGYDYSSTGNLCNVNRGAQDKDNAQSYCQSTASGCTARTWIGSQGTGGNLCCGDDGASDDFSTYSGSLTTSTSSTCNQCLNGASGGVRTRYGNGYTTGSLTTSTSLSCIYGDISCSGGSSSDGASATRYGNGYTTGTPTTSTSLLCYYGDISCSNGASGNGASATRYGNGYYSGSLTTSTSLTCYYGDISCSDGASGNGASAVRHGNGWYSGSLTTTQVLNCYSGDISCSDGASADGEWFTQIGNGWVIGDIANDLTVTCYYGDISCGDGTYSSGTNTYVRGNGYVSGSTCYYGQGTCGDGTYANGASCTLGAGDVCTAGVGCVAQASCPTQTQVWSPGGGTVIPCTDDAVAGAHGTVRALTDPISGLATGSATATCTNGIWILTNTFCDPGIACFAAGEEVSTPTGLVPIESIKEGDVVISYNHTTNKKTTSVVGYVIVHDGKNYNLNNYSKDPLVKVTFETNEGEKETKVTLNHPYYDPILEDYKDLREFNLGDKVSLGDTLGTIKTITVLIDENSSQKEKQTIVYNLHMKEGPHNYFVDGILVHNKL